MGSAAQRFLPIVGKVQHCLLYGASEKLRYALAPLSNTLGSRIATIVHRVSDAKFGDLVRQVLDSNAHGKFCENVSDGNSQ